MAHSRAAVALAVAVAAAAAVISGISVLHRPFPMISYRSSGWTHECAKWDDEGGRFLVSTFLDGGVAEVSPAGGDERIVISGGGDVSGMMSVGIHIDRQRNRLLVVYTGKRRAALAAHDLSSWRRIFLAPLAGPEDEASVANDVTTDAEGNAFVTDTKGDKIWKVTVAGDAVSVMRSGEFAKNKGPWLFNAVVGGLNGIAHHPNGYLLAVHTSSGRLFKISVETDQVQVRPVRGVEGSFKMGDGLLFLSSARLVVAGVVSRLIESGDDWESAAAVGRFVGLVHRLPTTATEKDGKVYVNHLFGFGLPGKRTNVIAEAVFV